MVDKAEEVRFAADSLLEGTRFEPSVPPTRFFRERPRFSSISSARLAIPWSRVPMRVGRVPCCLALGPQLFGLIEMIEPLPSFPGRQSIAILGVDKAAASR